MSQLINRLSPSEAQEKHRLLVTELQAAYAERQDSQEKVNKAIRLLRACERKCQNLGEQLANIDQLRLALEGKAGANV
jgi:hypothetical protein